MDPVTEEARATQRRRLYGPDDTKADLLIDVHTGIREFVATSVRVLAPVSGGKSGSAATPLQLDAACANIVDATLAALYHTEKVKGERTARAVQQAQEATVEHLLRVMGEHHSTLAGTLEALKGAVAAAAPLPLAGGSPGLSSMETIARSPSVRSPLPGCGDGGSVGRGGGRERGEGEGGGGGGAAPAANTSPTADVAAKTQQAQLPRYLWAGLALHGPHTSTILADHWSSDMCGFKSKSLKTKRSTLQSALRVMLAGQLDADVDEAGFNTATVSFATAMGTIVTDPVKTPAAARSVFAACLQKLDAVGAVAEFGKQHAGSRWDLTADTLGQVCGSMCVCAWLRG